MTDGRSQRRRKVAGVTVRLAGIATAAMLAACDTSPSMAVASTKATPALWEVADADTRVFLLGTVHQLPEGIDWNDGAVRVAIDTADGLLVELAPVEQGRAAAEFRRLSTPATDLPPLAERLPPELRPPLTLLLQRAGLRRRAVDGMESWSAALTLAQAQARMSDLSVLRGVDAVLATRFEIDDKPVIGLESAAQQLGLFDRLSEDAQRAMLAHVVRTSARGDASDRMRAMIDVWASGDVDALDGLLADDLAAVPQLRPQLLVARNAAWTDRIAAMMRAPAASTPSGDAQLVAVGAGHLTGSDGLPARLRARGFAVRRLQ